MLTEEKRSFIKPLFKPDRLFQAILQTVAYADVFDYPLRLEEIYRYLHGMEVTQDEIESSLNRVDRMSSYLSEEDGFYALSGRAQTTQTRKLRAEIADRLWPRAEHYGRWVSRLPFVRMVAVTGALAMDNEPGNDLDYLIVTEPGRLWLCRGLVILIVRWAARMGDLVCPNYLLSENALTFSQRDLYTAHELTQMVPLSGMQVYWKIREANRWTVDFLPNALGVPRLDIPVAENRNPHLLQGLAEGLLRSRPGGWVESWEMKRKIRKFGRIYPASQEADFCADWCKGHFGGYGRQTLMAYSERIQVFNE
jgi:hypothetical protein